MQLEIYKICFENYNRVSCKEYVQFLWVQYGTSWSLQVVREHKSVRQEKDMF